MRIRAARREDYGVVTRLLEELGRPHVGGRAEAECAALYDQQVVDPDMHHLVAETESGIVAFCSLQFRGRLNWPTPEAWIGDLVVTESARRVGIGLALLEEAQRRARERDCHVLVSESGYNAAEVHHLFRQFKMRDLGKQFLKELRRPG